MGLNSLDGGGRAGVCNARVFPCAQAKVSAWGAGSTSPSTSSWRPSPHCRPLRLPGRGCHLLRQGLQQRLAAAAGGFLLYVERLDHAFLAARGLIAPLTEWVGSMSQPAAFAGSFAVVLVLLAATGILSGRRSGNALNAGPLREPA